MALFGIVTDSMLYIILELDTDGIFMLEEHSGKLRVHRANIKPDKEEILGILDGLFQWYKRFVSPSISLISE